MSEGADYNLFSSHLPEVNSEDQEHQAESQQAKGSSELEIGTLEESTVIVEAHSLENAAVAVISGKRRVDAELDEVVVLPKAKKNKISTQRKLKKTQIPEKNIKNQNFPHLKMLIATMN